MTHHPDVTESGNAPIFLDDGAAGSNEGQDNLENDNVIGSECEEDEIDNVTEASGCRSEAKDDVRGWCELREQIKADLDVARRRCEPLTHLNQLLILRNFATLRMRGVRCIAVSEQIAMQ